MLIMIITTPINFRVVHIVWKNMFKTHNNKDLINEVAGQTQMLKVTKSETEDKQTTMTPTFLIAV